MGTWGEGLFENDSAADIVMELVEADTGEVEGMLAAFLAEAEGGYDSDLADAAAAAALVFFAIDRTGIEAHEPYLDPADWPRPDWRPSPALVRQARDASAALVDREGEEFLPPAARAQLRDLAARG